jgi:hypothetical protein
VEVEFCELRLYGVLEDQAVRWNCLPPNAPVRGSPPAAS